MEYIIERGSNITSRTCQVCGKSFIPTYYWTYKIGSKYYCRYNCYKAGGGDGRTYRTNIKRG